MTLSFANFSNLPEIDELYARYLKDPASVDSSWRLFFDGMQLGLALPSRQKVEGRGSPDFRIHELIHAYRSFGHLMAEINPLALSPPEEPEELKLEKLGFKAEELLSPFPTVGFLKEETAPLQAIVDALKQTYCSTIGIEYMEQSAPQIEEWLQRRIEPGFPLNLKADDKIDLLHHLNRAEIFESFIHTKYVGQKRFSLEGGETLVPMLIAMIEEGAEEGVSEAVLGMAHRGRLNVLANILNKSYTQIFHEFEDFYAPDLFEGTGDVKYHKGFTGALRTRRDKEVKVSLSPNPSHLESVDPVVEGEVRAKQELKGDKKKRREVVPILIHGDAAIAGQGVVYETLQLMRLNGYATGGTIHIVINNQIGFTTLPKDTRSTRYCTDIARAFGSPVFHVNAEDPEGCVAAAKIAIQLRQRFECDVFIDLNCYRKYGHNESDEPSFTQPLEYKLIHEKRSIRTLYQEKLIQEGTFSALQAGQLEEEFRSGLHQALEAVQQLSQEKKEKEEKRSKPKANLFQQVPTKVSASLLQKLAEAFCRVPEGFHLNSKIKRLFDDRLAMVKGDPAKPTIDWGMGEHLAFATLLFDGIHVRLSGQDVRRGTFSHRHGILVDQENAEKYFPLAHLNGKQAPFDIFNSPLSEFAALGFEFGYSLYYPKSLVIWEAQFGDFVNGAQIILDQYLAASEQKWGTTSNLTLLLPHGYEGQGPEHSSARIERFLQLSGDDSLQVANCSTPAQFFHLLRRQALREVKKPLIIFTPKALLRHPVCTSPMREFTDGGFQEILDDPVDVQNLRRLIFCSGKVFYELFAEREKRKALDVALLRVEQLYPLNRGLLKEKLQKYKGFKDCFWVQEEPMNMGAWEYIRPLLQEELGEGVRIQYVGRARSASPAAGSYVLHKRELAELLNEALR